MMAFCNFFITSLRAFHTIILPSVIYHSRDELFIFKVDTKFLTNDERLKTKFEITEYDHFLSSMTTFGVLPYMNLVKPFNHVSIDFTGHFGSRTKYVGEQSRCLSWCSHDSLLGQ